MKKKLLLILSIIMLLTACGSSGNGGGNNNKGTPPVPVIPSKEIEVPTVITVPDAPYVPFNQNDPHNITTPRSEGLDGSNITIGIIDSDFDADNIEFKDSSGSSRFILEPGYTGNGSIHGTLVTEIAAGRSIGIAPNAKIRGISAGINCDDGNSSCVKTTLDMYEKLYSNNVRIFNQSFGNSQNVYSVKKSDFPLTNPLIDFYYNRALQDSLFIWSTGNEGSPEPGVDSALPFFYIGMDRGWIAVTAVDSKTGEISDYANKCGIAKYWCLAAVGDYEFSSINVIGTGTSYAAPAVTGTAALVLQKFPWMNGDLIRQTILSTATDKGKLGVDEIYGWGLLNIEKAVKGPAIFDRRLALGSHIEVTFDNYTSYFENDISGNAGIIKDGTGTLILTGNNTYTGDNIVKGGVLSVNGKIISPVSIQTNGIFSSNGGYIDNSIMNNGGTFKNEKNGSYISGDYIASSDSIIENTEGATIRIKGKAVLSNSELRIILPTDNNNNPIYISSYNNPKKIITADKGIENTFGSVLTPSLLTGDIKYNENDIEVNLKRKNLVVYSAEIFNSDATRVNSASNLESVFKVLDNTTENSELKIQAAKLQYTLSSNIFGYTLDSLSGQIYASAQALTFQQSHTINKDLSNRLTMLGSINNLENTGLWFNAVGSRGKLYKSGYAKADTYLYGGQIGIDRTLNNNLILGASIAFSDSKADFDRYAGKSKSQNVGISIYGRYGLANDSFYILGRLGGAYVTSDVEREIIVNGYSEKLSTDHNDYVISGYGELGYKTNLFSKVSIIPFVGLMYDSVNRGKFSEDENLFGLHVDSHTYFQTSGLLGLKTETNFDWIAGKSALQGYFSWQNAFNNDDLSFEASYTGLRNNKFKIKGIGLPYNTIWTGIGIITEVTPVWSWYSNYDIQIQKSKLSNNIFSIGARVNLN